MLKNNAENPARPRYAYCHGNCPEKGNLAGFRIRFGMGENTVNTISADFLPGNNFNHFSFFWIRKLLA
ncbi:hypothetical protein BES34_010850 [Leptospira inadai serovar Lyme]|uniref:Uncharacterized protein n=1 Tax=Leptospira inadai serovar Lyme TaxID=293084 RepID=A0ABX4YIF8_9LEPT|nr:hypothetical protein BES34_010850 [Leptospira inadai serovar Lyme]